MEQSGRMSLRRPKPPIKEGSAPEEEEDIYIYIYIYIYACVGVCNKIIYRMNVEMIKISNYSIFIVQRIKVKGPVAI